ncbi:unnamed protein product [Gadus morhua 'NCC']
MTSLKPGTSTPTRCVLQDLVSKTHRWRPLQGKIMCHFRWSGHGGGSVRARRGPSTRQQRHQCPCSTHCRSGPQPNRGKERDGRESLGSLNTLL